MHRSNKRVYFFNSKDHRIQKFIGFNMLVMIPLIIFLCGYSIYYNIINMNLENFFNLLIVIFMELLSLFLFICTLYILIMGPRMTYTEITSKGIYVRSEKRSIYSYSWNKIKIITFQKKRLYPKGDFPEINIKSKDNKHYHLGSHDLKREKLKRLSKLLKTIASKRKIPILDEYGVVGLSENDLEKIEKHSSLDRKKYYRTFPPKLIKTTDERIIFVSMLIILVIAIIIELGIISIIFDHLLSNFLFEYSIHIVVLLMTFIIVFTIYSLIKDRKKKKMIIEE